MTDIETRLSKFTSASGKEEAKAASWIARNPGWTLLIGIVLLMGDIVLAFKAYG